MADNEALQQFLAVTGAPADAANFYLESANGDVEAAVSAYFESGAQPQPTATAAAGSAAPAAGGSRRQPPRAARAAGGVRSLGDLGNDDEDSDDDGPQGNELFTGGAKSGQVVKAPKKDKDKKQHDVSGLFDRARQAGAVAASELSPSERGDGGGAFRGKARTLGDAGEPEEAQPAEPAEPEPVVHTITFYNNGIFTVDDGEPRNMADPANRPFMESIARGECPRELESSLSRAPVNVNMVRADREYVAPPKPAYVAFGGAARTLAGPEPAAAAAAAPASGSSSAAGPSSAGAGPSSAGIPLTTWSGPDESQPTTSIQLRLADGSRLVARFNLTQTVGDIRSFIATSRPDVAPGYRLATAFPAAALDDDTATIQAAGLQNAVVVQKP